MSLAPASHSRPRPLCRVVSEPLPVNGAGASGTSGDEATAWKEQAGTAVCKVQWKVGRRCAGLLATECATNRTLIRPLAGHVSGASGSVGDAVGVPHAHAGYCVLGAHGGSQRGR